jgi:hypothetical protein
MRNATLKQFALVLLTALSSPTMGQTLTFQPLFRGDLHDCDGPNFSGHLPAGFICRGYGTGVGVCAKVGDSRIITYELPPDYCHLDFAMANPKQMTRVLQYLQCKKSNPECGPAFGE